MFPFEDGVLKNKTIQNVSHNYLDWAKYQNRHSSKSIQVMKLSFGQNDPTMRESF